MTFSDLGLCPPILKALETQGYQTPSPIQEKAIPPALAGQDVLGCAQTGTGKTCAFATPILQRLNAKPAANRPIRALILTPTRELAIQIDESFQAYGHGLPLRSAVIFGGVSQGQQVMKLKRGVDILVATPGRLGDLYQQKLLNLSNVEIFVLDEADRMLDMGFIHDVRRILTWLPKQKQTMLFSATMPAEISDLVDSLLHNPARVAVNPVSSPVEAIEQSVYLVDKGNKTRLLAHLMRQQKMGQALVFTRTKHGANKVARELEQEGITSAAIHGNKSQGARQQALAEFKAGQVHCLVATDIAARGLDIEDLPYVINYNLPEVPETYVHRIGRTGRAGREGIAVAFCDYSEKPLLKEIEKLIGRKITLQSEHPFPMQVFEGPKKDSRGRVVNAEDAEARAAAKERRRLRAAQEGQPVTAKSVSSSSTKKTQPVKNSPTPRPRQEVKPVPAPRPRGTRPGSLMDTGSDMPNPSVARPNPMDSDTIMDATARLLAPRPGAAAHTQQARRKPAGTQAAQAPGKPPERTPAKRAGQVKSPAPSAPTPNRERRNTRRGAPPQPQRANQTKDSTEQPSLMKPYYLDIGR